jgi:starch-binding outer membrane protein, SusD/RagB family
LTFAKYGNVAEMSKLVLLERQRELMFDGKRWFDLVRLSNRENSTEKLVGYVRRKYTSNLGTIMSKLSVIDGLYMPIYTNELINNNSLVQNPYYISTTSVEK